METRLNPGWIAARIVGKAWVQKQRKYRKDLAIRNTAMLHTESRLRLRRVRLDSIVVKEVLFDTEEGRH